VESPDRIDFTAKALRLKGFQRRSAEELKNNKEIDSTIFQFSIFSFQFSIQALLSFSRLPHYRTFALQPLTISPFGLT